MKSMKNWRTTLIGVGCASFHLILTGISTGLNFKDAALSAGIALLGILAKDAQVTGGTSFQGNSINVLSEKADEKKLNNLH